MSGSDTDRAGGDAGARRRALGEFLRSRRARLQPADVDLPPGRRRRTPGLRREEVAHLAAIGPTWYTALEQGRDIHVSAHVLDSLARALRLNTTERAHLFALANREPLVEPGERAALTPALQALLDHHEPLPGYVMDQRWDVLGWNRAAAALFGDFATLPPAERNMVWLLFTAPRLRTLLVDWEAHAQQVLGQFRASWGRHADDPAFGELIGRLRQTSPEFDA